MSDVELEEASTGRPPNVARVFTDSFGVMSGPAGLGSASHFPSVADDGVVHTKDLRNGSQAMILQGLLVRKYYGCVSVKREWTQQG